MDVDSLAKPALLQDNIHAAMIVLHVKYGSWRAIAKAMGVQVKTIKNARGRSKDEEEARGHHEERGQGALGQVAIGLPCAPLAHMSARTVKV
jgi:hypothetical protein